MQGRAGEQPLRVGRSESSRGDPQALDRRADRRAEGDPLERRPPHEHRVLDASGVEVEPRRAEAGFAQRIVVADVGDHRRMRDGDLDVVARSEVKDES